MAKKQTLTDLSEIERHTIGLYDNNAEFFWQRSKDHDDRQNIGSFLKALPQNKAMGILNFGRRPGRDLKTFKSLGHRAVGLDGSKVFCQLDIKHRKQKGLAPIAPPKPK